MNRPNVTIRQLIPMPDRFEFQYLFCNYSAGDLTKVEIGVHRVPMLGLALVDFPSDRSTQQSIQQSIVHFGNDTHGQLEGFQLYCEYGWRSSRYVPHFFSNDPQTRALGIAPLGSGDDYFDEVGDATEQLESEQFWGKAIRSFLSHDGENRRSHSCERGIFRRIG